MTTDTYEQGTVGTAWPADTLRKIIDADDLHIAPLRGDGVTPGTPTWIWAVAVEGALYVRGYNGQASRWYQAARSQKAGQITAAGSTWDTGALCALTSAAQVGYSEQSSGGTSPIPSGKFHCVATPARFLRS